MSSLQEFEASRGHISRQIRSLKRQSIVALLLALVLIVYSLYLLAKLDTAKQKLLETNEVLEASKDSLTRSNKALTVMNDSIGKLNAELDGWRQGLAAQNNPSFQANANSAGHRTVSKYLTNERALTRGVFLANIIYIHDRNGNKVSAPLQQYLIDQGAIVPGIEHISPKMRYASTVKYWHPEDLPLATELLRQVKAMYEKYKSPVANLEVRLQKADKKVPKGQFEIWIDK